MAFNWTSYYGFGRVSEVGPEVKNWIATDTNWQNASLLFKRFEGHHHNAATPMRYPGYNTLTPATPIVPLLTQFPTGGFIAAGTSVGIRTSFLDQFGLETEAAPEISIQMPAAVARPNPPIAAPPVATPIGNALPGGTFIYTITKRQNTGESMVSDVTTVDVPFDQTGTSSYFVPLTFDPISSYSDGTDSILIYRTSGFDSSFVLLTTILATPGDGSQPGSTTAYNDIGVVADYSHQPPQTSEFGKQNSLLIDWSNITIPATVYKFRIYLTQQTGVYATTNLYQEYLLVNPATPFPTNVTYVGTEALTPGYPLEFTQIPAGADLINLTTEAIGAPYYTQPANAQGWQTWNFILPDQNHATPMFGAMYADSSVGQLKVCLATPGGTGVFTTFGAVGSGYAHPVIEQGGHASSHVQFAPNVGGPTMDQIGSIIATPVAGGQYRKQVTTIYQFAATPMNQVTSNTSGFQPISDMDSINQWPNGISPDFAGQWFEFNFTTNGNQNLFVTPNGGGVNLALYINGVQIPDSIMGYAGHFEGFLDWTNYQVYFATPLTRCNNRVQIQWYMTIPGVAMSYGTNIPGVNPRRQFIVKELF